MTMLQMLQWKYAGDPRAAQYSECLKEYHSKKLSDKRPELKNILMFLANEYKKNITDTKMLSVIMTDMNEYYKYLDLKEQMEFHKLLGKMENKNNE